MEDEIIKANAKDEDEEIYEVEKIIGMTKSKGKIQYRVRWLGYDSAWDTWEPAENLDTCDDLIEKYLQSRKRRQHKQARERQEIFQAFFNQTPSTSVETQSHEDSNDSKYSQSSDSKKLKKGGVTWEVVDSSDEEFDTLKDSFWRDLENGKVNVFKTDMYSSVKGVGARASRPQSFKDVFKNKPASTVSTETASVTKKNPSNISASSEKATTPTSSDKPIKNRAFNVKTSSNTSKSRYTERKSDSKPILVKAEIESEPAKLPKLVIKTGKDKMPKVIQTPLKDPLIKTVKTEVKEAALDSSPKASLGKAIIKVEKIQPYSDPTSKPIIKETSPSKGTLKDTFWKDLEEGKIDVFESDMYSKVKGTGARSSRPQSFKTMFAAQPLVQKESTESPNNDKKKQSLENGKFGEDQGKQREKRATTERKEKSPRSSTSLSGSHQSENRGGNVETVVTPPIDKSLTQNTEGSVPPHLSVSLGEHQKLLSCYVSLEPMATALQTHTQTSVSPSTLSCESEANPRMEYVNNNTTPESPPVTPRKRSDSESSTEVPSHSKPETPDGFSKRKRASDSESSGEVPMKRQNLESSDGVNVINLDNTHFSKGSVSATCSILEIEEFNLEDFNTSPKVQSNSIAKYNSASNSKVNSQEGMEGKDFASVPSDHQSSQDSGVQILFENSPVAGTDNDLDLLRRIAESGSDQNRENNNQGEKELKLDFIDFDVSDLGLPFTQLQKLQAQGQQTPASPVILNQVEFRHAVKNGDFDRVQQALKHSKKSYDLEQGDPDGVTLVMICALRGYDDILELLARYGANINAVTRNGTTALMMACEKNRLCTVNQLIMMGAHLNRETSNTCETALLKSVKRGHIQVASTLLDAGSNFNSPTREEMSARQFSKNYQQKELLNLITDHNARVRTEFEAQVKNTLNNTAKIKRLLFPMQCLSLCESDSFKICFKHELEATQSGVGMLLFIGHARVSLGEIKCRFYGPCAVNSVKLNEDTLHPLTEEGKFVMSFGPLLNGKNELHINTVSVPTSRAKLLVCAYTAKLVD